MHITIYNLEREIYILPLVVEKLSAEILIRLLLIFSFCEPPPCLMQIKEK